MNLLFDIIFLYCGCSSFFAVVYSSIKCERHNLALPRTKKRTCLIATDGPLWVSGCPVKSKEELEENYLQVPECRAYAGMELTIKCSSADEIVWYRNGQKRNTSGILEFSFVELSDSGLYECRTNHSNGGSSVPFNVSISSGQFVISLIKDLRGIGSAASKNIL